MQRRRRGAALAGRPGKLAGSLDARCAGCSLAGWLLAARCFMLAAGWLAGWLAEKNGPLLKNGVRWKSKLHCHLMLILSQNQTSIHEEYFPCGTFSYQHGFVNEKHVQRGPRHKKSRCPWDGVYLRTSMATSGEPSTWFPLE